MKFLDESLSRVPLTDWFDTVTGAQSGFQARSVVGSAHLPMLYDDAIWQKWIERAEP